MSKEKEYRKYVQLRTLLLRVVRFIRSLYFFLHILWINIHNAFTESCPRYAKTTDSDIKAWFHIAVIGDDLVLGTGDWVTVGKRPGLVGHMETYINQRPTVKAPWRCYKMGMHMASTQSWLPSSTVIYRNQMNLFEYAFHPDVGVFRHVPMVVIMLGMHDKCSPIQTVQNICTIADEIMRRTTSASEQACTSSPSGVRKVFVSTIPCPSSTHRKDEPTTSTRRANHPSGGRSPNQPSSMTQLRNSELRSYVRNSSSQSKLVSFSLGPDLEAALSGRYDSFARFDGLGLTSAGHRAIAKLWADGLENSIVQIEWKWLQNSFFSSDS